jgi:hypothetical protein
MSRLSSRSYTAFIPGHEPMRATMQLPELAPPPAPLLDEIPMEITFEMDVVERPARTPTEQKASDERVSLMEMMNVIAGIALARGDEFTYRRADRLFGKAYVDEFWDGFGRRS